MEMTNHGPEYGPKLDIGGGPNKIRKISEDQSPKRKSSIPILYMVSKSTQTPGLPVTVQTQMPEKIFKTKKVNKSYTIMSSQPSKAVMKELEKSSEKSEI